MILFALLSALLTLCLLVGCAAATPLEKILSLNGNAQADALIEAIDTATEDGKLSYRMNTVVSANMDINGITVEVTVKTTEVNVAPDEEKGVGHSAYVLTESNAVSHLNGQKISEESSQLIGYHEGKIFLSEKSSDTKVPTMHWSSGTKEAYDEFCEKMLGVSSSEQLLGYKMRTCTHDSEAHIFTLTLADPNEELLAKLNKSFEGTDAEIENVTEIYKVSEDFLPISAEMTISAKNATGGMTGHTTYTYKNVAFDQEVDLRDHKKSADLTLLPTLREEIKKVQDAEEGTYEFYTRTLISSWTGFIPDTTYEETNAVHYWTDDEGHLCFSIKVDDSYMVHYADGKMTVEQENGETEVKDYTEEDARALIEKQLRPVNLSSGTITDYKLAELTKGRYFIKISGGDKIAFQSIAAQLGGSLSDVTYYITYREGVLYSFEYEIEVSVNQQSGVPYTVTVTSVVTLREG